jgi:hypothetical protein
VSNYQSSPFVMGCDSLRNESAVTFDHPNFALGLGRRETITAT